MNKQTDDGQSQAPVTDDQELANVLAGMNQQAAQPTAEDLQFEETPLTAGDDTQTTDTPTDDASPASADEPVAAEPAVEEPAAAEVAEATLPAIPPLDMPDAEAPAEVATPAAVTTASPELETIKKSALEELRPLVDRLDLPADEKFDTLLLIIRSTDDQSLVGAAHDAAKAIEDEAKRAAALLDVIKEIDYFANQSK